ncbi:glycosyltransferase family 4 protein [Thioalkalivibrio sp. ALE11]|uniref:glycosyltransferase family 4 protein n=1 Tax=Thioalkalivibrio sp. ALE11 TaxID=1265494 RepID=UPI000375DC04|nr:glycosyltransferase family 4 protein [Thioalkalivibrio sp. ALE11]
MGERVLVVGGVARSLVNFRGALLDDLQTRGHTVQVAAGEDHKAALVRETLAGKGVEFHPIPVARGSINPLADLATLWKLWRLFRDQRPTVVIAYTAKPVIYAGIATRALGGIRFCPMITGLGYAFVEGGGLRRRMLRLLVGGLYRRGLARADTVIFQNPDDQSRFHQLGLVPPRARSLRVGGSGVDTERFSRQPLPDAPVFLMLARLLADKGVREYVEAARRVRTEFPQARFLLAGAVEPNPAGIRRDELDRWQAEGAVEYLGLLDDVRPALAGCRYYVLPSYHEGTPRSVLEAMATGRPIITTDAPGCRETVVHECNGLLVAPGDARSLAEAMRQMLRMPERAVQRMAEESERLVHERFEVHRVNASILAATGL